ncbi:protein kinase domain-containing protein [Singulisphaera rosea]
MDDLKTSHPSDRDLAEYGLGRLDESLASSIHGHLERCEECRSRVIGLSHDTFLGRLREAGLSPGDTTLSRGELEITPTSRSLQGEPAPPPVDSLPPGLASHLDYRIRKELGRGGMGVVYLAQNLMMGRDEVLKVINQKVMERPGVLERFQREIRAVANLRHPNIVTAYTAFRIEGGLVFSMEYVEGLDLARLVQAKGPLSVEHAAHFAYQVSLGLQHAFERGTVHRDIKPQNLMLTHDGKRRLIKILDFGLAKANREGSLDTTLTHEGQALGTPDYIAPEQILNATNVDIRADIYSLGGTMYYLLTGRPPFLAKSLYDIYQSHISREASPLNLIRPEVPAELASLVAKMLTKERSRRFQTPDEVAKALTPFFRKPAVGGAGTGRTTAQDPRASRNPQPLRSKKTSPNRAEPRAKPPSEPIPHQTKTVVEDSKTPWSHLIDTSERDVPGTLPESSLTQALHRRKNSNWAAILAIAGTTFSVLLLGILVLTSRGPSTAPKTSPANAGVPIVGEKAIVRRAEEAKVDLGGKPGEPGLIVKPLAQAPDAEGVTPLEAELRPAIRETPKLTPTEVPNGFTPLFNGKNTEGWGDDQPNGSGWFVEDGILIGKGGDEDRAYALLRTDRANFANFRMRMKFLNSDRRDKSIALYSRGRGVGENPEEATYRVVIGTPSIEGNQRLPVGSIIRGQLVGPDVTIPARSGSIKFGDWAEIELVYSRNRLTTLVNGKEVAAYNEPNGGLEPVRIGLYCEAYTNLHVKDLVVEEFDRKSSVGMRRPVGEGRDARVATPLPRTSLVRDDFPATIRAGRWAIEGDELVQSERLKLRGAILLFGSPFWSDYDFEFKGKATHGTHLFKGLFHHSGGERPTTYAFALGNYHNTGDDLSFDINGNWGRHNGFFLPMKREFDRWFHVRIEVRKADFRCYVDGREEFHGKDDRFRIGRVGLSTWDSTARFKEIRVVAPDGEILFEGLPRLPQA